MTREEEAEAAGLRMIGPYLGVMAKTDYFCEIHGIIKQTPNKVQQGIGCQRCGRESQFSKRRKPIKEIRKEAEAVGLEYVSGFINSATSATYMCVKHGKIEMRPDVIARGSGCKQCGTARIWESRGRKSDDELMQEAIAVGLEYVSGYKTAHTKALYRCPMHGLIEKTQTTVQRGSGCRFCARNAPKTEDRLRQEAENVGLSYIGGFVNSNTKAKYICSKHGEIEMNPGSVHVGRGCRFCAKNTVKDEETLKKEAAAVELEYIGPYNGDSIPTKYRCPTHGEIEKTPGGVKGGSGCQSCAKFGFDPGKPATFYAYRASGRVLSFIGYGITNTPKTRHIAHSKRLDRHGLVAEKVLEIKIPGSKARRLEAHIQDTLKDAHFDTGIQGFKKEAIRMDFYEQFLAVIRDWTATNLAVNSCPRIAS